MIYMPSIPMSKKVKGSERPVGKGTAGALFNTVRKDGTPTQVFRIYKKKAKKLSGKRKRKRCNCKDKST